MTGETTILVSVTRSNVSVQRILVNGIDPRQDTSVRRLPLLSSTDVSGTISLPEGGARIEIVVRLDDGTEDGFTEASYIVDIGDVIILDALDIDQACG